MRRIITASALLTCFLAMIGISMAAIPAPGKPYKSFTLQETRLLAQAGFADESANQWLDAMIRREAFDKYPAERRLAIINFLIEWKKTGLTLQQASAWDSVLSGSIYWDEPPKTIRKLAAAGVTPDDLSGLAERQLERIGKPLKEVYAMQAKGVTLPPHVNLDSLADWVAAGFYVEEAEFFLKNGKRNGKARDKAMTIPAAKAWKEAGFSPGETVDYYAVTRSTAAACRIKALGIPPAEAAEGFRVIDNAKTNAPAAAQTDPEREYTFKPYFIYSPDKARLQEFLPDLAKNSDEARIRLLESLHKGTISYLRDPLKVKVVADSGQLIQLQDVISGHTIWTIKRSLR
jgi:hypothetical protein